MLKILDLFAGAGGLSLGFEQTNQFEVAGIVENNPNAAKTYLGNHPGLKNYKDILSVDFNKIKKECGTIDVIIGGPPCQGFSNANRQRRHLINGSNELVKKYVEAIKQIKPRVFVMENVKTIASDKHSFCVTNDDEIFVKNELGLQTHIKDIVLYDGILVNEVFLLIKKYEDRIEDIMLINEDDLYFIYNLYKKNKQKGKLLAKTSNIKILKDIVTKLVERAELPDWYNDCTTKTKIIINQLLNEGVDSKEKWGEALIQFWDIHRFFIGIKELKEKDAIFSYNVTNKEIHIKMQTYIVIDYIKAAFHYLGYEFRGEVLNAASYGVPQTRERFILIGVKSELLNGEITLPEAIINDPRDYVTVQEAINDLESIEPTVEAMSELHKRTKCPVINSYFSRLVMVKDYQCVHNHVCTATRQTTLERFEQIAPGQNFHSLPDDLKNSYENPDRTQNTVYKRLDPNFPSDTVVNVRKSMWIHPRINRAVSAREAARLQSFPDNYIFYGTKDSVYQQIGNAVPPVLGRAVAESVLDLFGINRDEYESLSDIYDEYQ